MFCHINVALDNLSAVSKDARAVALRITPRSILFFPRVPTIIAALSGTAVACKDHLDCYPFDEGAIHPVIKLFD